MNKTFILILSLLLVLSCNKDDKPKETFNPKTIEDVIASRDYYFTFYLDGELWYTKPKDNPKFTDPDWQMEFELDEQNDANGNFELFALEAFRWPDTSNPDEKEYFGPQTLHIYFYDVSNDMVFPKGIDTIPYELNYSYNPDSSPSIFFENNFYTQDYYLANGGHNLAIHRKLNQLKFNIDKVEIQDENGNIATNGFKVLYGRLEGVFTNNQGHSVHITEGQFKVRRGTWKNKKK